MHRSESGRPANLTELVKNVVLGFCKINVPYTDRLDVYGSLHIRADDVDVASFMLNEHCYNSRANSPTITSAQPVDQESDCSLTGGQACHRVKTEATVKTDPEEHDDFQWSNADSAAAQRGQNRSSQCLSSTSQVDDVASSVSNATSKHLVLGDEVKCEQLYSEVEPNYDHLSDDASVEILEDDPAGYCADANSQYKSEVFTTEDGYSAEMYGYGDNFPSEYDDPAYQYPDVSTNSDPDWQPASAGNSRKRCAASMGRSSSEKTCLFCQKKFVSDAELATHFQQYHQCNAPPVSQKRKTHLHQVDQMPNSVVSVGAAENVVKMYKCRFCGALYRSLDGLSNHENVKHSRNKRYQCSFCSQEFLTRQAAYTHRVKFHRLLSRKVHQ